MWGILSYSFSIFIPLCDYNLKTKKDYFNDSALAGVL